MRTSLAFVRTVIGVAAGLLLASLQAAEPSHPLLGASREQVLSRYGEPKGQISLGSRTVLTYAQEKFVLRNGVVVEVEPLAGEPVRRPAPVAAAQTDSAAPVPPGAPVPAQPQIGTENAPTPVGSEPSAPPAAPAAPGAQAPKLAIKLVRPPGAAGAPASRPAPAPVAEAPAPPAAEVVPEPEPPPPGPDPKIEAERAAKAAQAAAQAAAKAAAEAAANDKRIKSAQSARRRLDFAETAQEEEGGLGRTLLIAALVVVAGLGGLAWWRRQQAIALAATSVASTPVRRAGGAAAVSAAKLAPFPAPAAVKPAFTAEFLAQLDAARFEELVAAYFVRTGVVATRANSGGASPLHLRLSWKGEPRAFACAHCIAQGPAEIEARALHAFAEALAAENLRRGYVVTSGGFSSGAVKFAASKQIILLSAGALLEKIKGLPESARNELMQVLIAEKKAA